MLELWNKVLTFVNSITGNETLSIVLIAAVAALVLFLIIAIIVAIVKGAKKSKAKKAAKAAAASKPAEVTHMPVEQLNSCTTTTEPAL